MATAFKYMLHVYLCCHVLFIKAEPLSGIHTVGKSDADIAASFKKDSKEPLPVTQCVQFFQTEKESKSYYGTKTIRHGMELKLDTWLQLSISRGAKEFLKNQAYSKDVFEFSDSPASTLLKRIPYKTYERCLNYETARAYDAKLKPHLGLELCTLELKDWLEIVSAATEQTPWVHPKKAYEKSTPFELKMMSTNKDKAVWSGAFSWVKRDESKVMPDASEIFSLLDGFGSGDSNYDKKYRLAAGLGGPYVMGVAVRILSGADLYNYDQEKDSWGYFEIWDKDYDGNFDLPKRFIFREYSARTEIADDHMKGSLFDGSLTVGEVKREWVDTFDLTLLEKPGYACNRGFHGVRLSTVLASSIGGFSGKADIKDGMKKLIGQFQDISTTRNIVIRSSTSKQTRYVLIGVSVFIFVLLAIHFWKHGIECKKLEKLRIKRKRKQECQIEKVNGDYGATWITVVQEEDDSK